MHLEKIWAEPPTEIKETKVKEEKKEQERKFSDGSSTAESENNEKF